MRLARLPRRSSRPRRASLPGPGLRQPAATLKTPWGEPDLQGLWTDESDTPLQRIAKCAGQEFFTEAQRAEIDRERAALLANDRRGERGTETDVPGAYNSVFLTVKRIGVRTSLIVDPPNGRLPPVTLEARKIAAADREFRLALLQATGTCKNEVSACAGGKYDPFPSPRRKETAARFNTGRMNWQDNPEDTTSAERCLTGGLPEFGSAFGGSFRRIVQTPGDITIFYHVGQGRARRQPRRCRVPRCFGAPSASIVAICRQEAAVAFQMDIAPRPGFRFCVAEVFKMKRSAESSRGLARSSIRSRRLNNPRCRAASDGTNN